MKSLVLTSQDARELEKFRGLTVTKPIKPAPKYVPGAKLEPSDSGREWHLVDESGRRLSRAAVPVEDTFSIAVCAGDVVFIREPWYRLQTPGGGDSDRVILAADSVVGESNVAYKWASPVSMPENAARRFARVKKVEPIYNENVTAWTIELEAISADEAKASEQGAPLSSASDPEDASTYFTYAGDMSAEDHEKMIAAIDADRARLEEVQNRILWIATRRMTIASELKKPVTDPPSVNEIALDGEDRALADELLVLTKEEETLRAALEDAGVPVQTIEDRARERLEEPPEPSEGGLSSSDNAQAEESTTAAEDDEEIGSFTMGKCKYCGREWGVTLEGAKGGGYPTQRTANAAATRVCDCAEAVENRTPIVGVAMAITTGACRWCGQLQEVGPHPSQATADDTASEVCNCPTARQERRVHEQVEDACERVQRLFGDDAENLGFKPIPDEAVGLLENVVEMIARGPISSASLNVRGRCKAKFSITSKGKIKVSRSETRSCDLEDGQ